VQKGGRTLREIIVTDAAQYKCNDLLLVSDHIGGSGIVDIDFQMLPTPRIYATRADGQLAVLTYEALYDMKAWSRFITGNSDLGDGFESISITSDSEGMDQVWAIVKRDVNGVTKRFIERFAAWSPFDWDTFKKAVYVDCATSISLLSAAVQSISFTTIITINATAHGLSDAMKIRLTGPAGGDSSLEGPIYTVQYIGVDSFSLRNETDTANIDATNGRITEDAGGACPTSWTMGDTLTGDTSSNTATITGFNAGRTMVYFGSASQFDPFATDTSITASTDSWADVTGECWLDATVDGNIDLVEQVQKEFTGYTRYAAKTLQVFADEIVQPPVEVDATGAFELAEYANYITFGLEYDSVLLLMPIEAGVGEGSAQGRKKRVDRITLRLIDSVGCMVGPALDDLYLAKFRQTNAEMGEVTQPQDGDIEIPFPGEYETFGDVYVVGNEPLPLTVVAVMPRMETTE
jgi:hypothetical protein